MKKIKLTSAATKFIKDNNFVCVGYGSSTKDLFKPPVKGVALDDPKYKSNPCYVGTKISNWAGCEEDTLYFCSPEDAANNGLIGRDDLFSFYKPKSEVIYFAPNNDIGSWVGKTTPSGHYVYNKNNSRPYFDGCHDIIRGSIKNGTYKKLSRTQFLSLIKTFGFKEDGTKIVAPEPAAPPPLSRPKLQSENIGQVWQREGVYFLVVRANENLIIAVSLRDLPNRYTDDGTYDPKEFTFAYNSLADYIKAKTKVEFSY